MIKNIFKRILILLVFIGLYLGASQKLSKEQTQLDIALSLISSMSETVHSLQQERGASCGYISSGGTKFKDKLNLIKLNSDKRISTLHNLLNNNQNILKQYFSNKQYNALDKTFDELFLIREKIQDLNINFAKTYSKYTQSIAFMLFQISNISDMLENKELSDKLYIYSTLLMYKESIGQKRVSLSSLFSKKKFAKEIFEYFLISDTQEKIYLKSFLHNLDKKMKNLYFISLNHQSVQIVKNYERLALDKLAGKSVDVDPTDWFTNVTKKIDLVQKVEHKIFEDILMIVYKINTNSLITLTKDEKRWLEDNQMIKIAVMDYWKHDKDGNSIHTDIIKCPVSPRYGRLVS